MTDAIRDAMQRRSFGDVFWWRFWPKSHSPRMAFYGAAPLQRVSFFLRFRPTEGAVLRFRPREGVRGTHRRDRHHGPGR